MTGIPQNKHLEKIEDDQSINGINTIDDTIRNEAGRKWFVSQAIQPILNQGRYVESTGRYNLGVVGLTVATYETTSQNTQTFTAPSKCRLKYCGYTNQSRAYAPRLTITLNSVACTYTAGTTIVGQTVTQGRIATMVGMGGSNGGTVASISEIIMNTGDTAVITDLTFVAADTVAALFLYEVI